MNTRFRMRGALLGMATIVLLAGCEPGVINGNGRLRQESRDLADFSVAVIHGDFAVTAQQGVPAKAELSADGNLLKHTTTIVRGEILTLDADKTLRSRHPLTVRLVSPALEGVTHVGRGPLTVKLVEAKSFIINVKNTGTVNGSGEAETLTIHSEGSGDVDLRDITAHNVLLTLTRDADIAVTATKHVTIDHYGSGTVTVYGSPTDVNNNNRGDGQVIIK